MAQPFDATRLTLSGQAMAVAEDVKFDGGCRRRAHLHVYGLGHGRPRL